MISARRGAAPRIVPALLVSWVTVSSLAVASDPVLDQRIKGLDAYMGKLVKDWNVPGVGVGVVVKDRLVFAKGYGFRDYGRKLPFTPQTTVPIASNTKLFTAIAAGLLVEEGKLDWDRPVRQFVPGIQFFNDELNATVTLRDMLSHRTGITRHDTIWYKSDFTRQELFERLKYLEPAQPLRQTFLYNNMMYAGAGRIVEMLSGKTWEDFLRERLLAPLGMTATVFTIDDLLRQPDHGVPFTERRDSFELYEIPYYREAAGVAPAGAIDSNLEDLSKWLVALMNDGKAGDRSVIPAGVLKATLSPAIALPNTLLQARGFGELLNPVYGMGRFTASYRGHLLTYHGGDQRLPFPGLVHAERRARGDRAGDRRSLPAALQRGLLQRVRASPGDGPDAVERARSGDPSERQGGGPAGALAGRRRARGRHEAVPPAGGVRRRVREPGVWPPDDLAAGRGTAVRLPQDPAAAQPFPLRSLRHARRRAGRQVVGELLHQSPGGG